MAPRPHPFRPRTGRLPRLPLAAAAIRATAPTVRAAPWRALLAAALLALATLGSRAQVAINTTGNAPAAKAMLDISSTNKGLLAPRMTWTQRTAITSPPNGLLVYQTDSTGVDTKGFYYYDGAPPAAGWRHMALGYRTWQLGGNTGTLPPTDFLGTTNNTPLVFRTNNNERGRLSATGELQLYYTLPPASSERVHVQGAVKLDGGSAGDHEGTIRFTPGSGGNPGRFEGYVVNAAPTGVDADHVNGWKQLDNNFHERKNQRTAHVIGGCKDPSVTAPLPSSVETGPDKWPITGPASGPYSSIGGAASPYYGVWEDSRKQYLYRASDIAAMGICPGNNPIRAIAFNVSSASYSTTRQHFLRIRLKNTGAVTTSSFDNAGFDLFAQPVPPMYSAPDRYYTPYVANATNPNTGTGAGYQVVSGWNVHAYGDGIPMPWPSTGFLWTGNNLLVDVAVDNQDWPVSEGAVQGYNSGYQSLIYMYCDACGGNGYSTCKWQAPQSSLPAGFYFPPTTPTNGIQDPAGTLATGWGWVGGWNLAGGTSTVICDGSGSWTGSGSTPIISNQLPRVAFLAMYVGGGVSYDVGNYMYANEGLMVGDATWAASGTYGSPTAPLKFRGPGTISAQRSIWSGNQLLTDYVFDLYYDGQARPEDAKGANGYTRVPLRELPNYVEQHRKLPNVDGRNAWNTTGAFSLDQITNQLWIAVEDQALYIKELNERMDALRQYLVDKKLRELEK